MDQTPSDLNSKSDNRNTADITPSSPVSSVPPLVKPEPQTSPVPDNILKSSAQVNMQNNGEQFKLASAEVQGPKPPLAAAGGSKFVLVAGALILITIVGIGGYYFYSKDNDFPPVDSSVAVSPKITPIADKNSDSDKDGLPDAIEKVLGAYMTKADTDGDGFNDLEEIKNGYNPLVAGGSGKYTQEQWDNVKGKIKIEDREFYEREFEAPAVLSPSSSPLVTPTATLTPLSFNCGMDTTKDIDNNIYNTVKIGEQCWLKENLKVTKNPAGVAITRYCYDNDPKICDTDGGLYDWNTAMNNSTTEGAQGICPNGWHVPKDSEWYVLESGLKDANKTCDENRDVLKFDCDTAGSKLIIGGISGFEGVFAGRRTIKYTTTTTEFNSSISFLDRGVLAFFWSSSDYGNSAWYRMLQSEIPGVYRGSDSKTANTAIFSVRCLKD